MAGLGVGRSERGQLLLAGAFVLAVTLIGLTIVITSSSYTTTLANQENEVIRGNDAVAIRESFESHLTRQFEYVFDNYGHGSRRAPFEAVVAPAGNETMTHYARRGRMVNVTMEPSDAGFIEGTRIKQTSSSFDFTQPVGGATGGSDYWYPAEHVEARNMTFVVTSVDSGTDLAEEGFNVTFETPGPAGDDWSIAMYQDFSLSKPFVVRTRSPEGVTRECRAHDVTASQKATINVDEGTLNGNDCYALEAIDPPRHKYTLRFTRGEKVNGKYWILVDKEPTEGIPTLNGRFDAGTRSTAEPVLFGVRVRYRYHSATVSYETNIDIAHREIG